MVPEDGSDDSMWGTSVDGATLRRLAQSWPARATIRTSFEPLTEPSGYEPERPDYPVRLVPFADHPDFLAAPEEKRQQVFTFAWLMYNERVVEAEECIVNPALALIVRKEISAPGGFALRAAVQQADVDEAWHTYMHMLAMEKTRSLRGIETEPDYADGVTHRALQEVQAENPAGWPQDLLRLAWATVSEATINAYLYLVAQNKEIQPHHSLVARLHARDESAHSSVMIEACRNIYYSLDLDRRRSFAASLPLAFDAFSPRLRRMAEHSRPDRRARRPGHARGRQPGRRKPAPGSRRLRHAPLVRALEIDEPADFDFAAVAERSRDVTDPASRPGR